MIYVIFGPTGSGKTDVACELASHLNAPIINADAFQIYKDMNIGTNKISKDDKFYKDTYLIDIVDPSNDYSVCNYQKDFRDIYSKLSKKYNDVIVCGGTGLYIKAALYDYEFKKENIQNIDYSGISNEELYSRLVSLDKEAASKIHVNNRKRVERAITLIVSSGEKKSEIIAQQKHELVYKNVKFIFLNPDREILYKKIEDRVDKMMQDGLVNEVSNLVKKYDLSQTSKQGIGYKEIISYLNGEIDEKSCVELIKKRTRNYAKRQVTFFKNQFESESYNSKEEIIKKVLNYGK